MSIHPSIQYLATYEKGDPLSISDWEFRNWMEEASRQLGRQAAGKDENENENEEEGGEERNRDMEDGMGSKQAERERERYIFQKRNRVRMCVYAPL